MLKFTEAQLAQLFELERGGWVEAVRDDIVKTSPHLAGDAGLLDRLVQADKQARAYGFTDDAAIAQFLHIEAKAPGFYRHGYVDRWLSKPGQPVEERFITLMEAATNKKRGAKSWQQ